MQGALVDRAAGALRPARLDLLPSGLLSLVGPVSVCLCYEALLYRVLGFGCALLCTRFGK